MIPERYLKNLSVYSEEEFAVLQNIRVTVVGAGGLGGHIIDQLARLGVGFLKILDFDDFDESNLNRQLNSDTLNIGCSKADAAENRVASVNPEVQVVAIKDRLVEENALELLGNTDLCFDAVDNVETKLLIQDSCRELGIPFVHGAVGTWTAQISLVMPGQDTLDSIYQRTEPEAYPPAQVPPFTPAAAASIQVVEGLKYLLGRHDAESRTLIHLNLQSGQIMRMDLGSKETT